MGHMREHDRWFKQLTNNASGRAAATHSDISPATLNRQLDRGTISAENVIALSRAYGQSPIAGLIATGYLTSEEGVDLTEEQMARMLSDQTLIRDMARRIDDNESAWAGTFGDVLSNAPEERSNVHQLHVGDMDDDEAAIREANELRGAAQRRTQRLDEPEST